MILEQAEKQSILDLMSNYKNLHNEINKVEKAMTELQKTLDTLNVTKDAVIKGLEDNRETESTVIKRLVEKYGEGKLNFTTFEWEINK